MIKYLVIFFVCIFNNAIAQQWKNWNTNNSPIPTNQVVDVATDDIGNVWLATNNGLVKFDGVNWTIFNSGNSPILSNICNDVETEGNIIWIADLWGGLIRFDGISSWTIYNAIGTTLNQGPVTNVNVDWKHRKWVTSWSSSISRGPLAMFNDTIWKTYTYNSFTPNTDYVQYPFVDNSGLIWMPQSFFSSTGLITLLDTTWQTLDTTNSTIPTNSVFKVVQDTSKNFYWMASDIGLLSYDKFLNSYYVYNSSNSLPFDTVLDICHNSQNTIAIIGFSSPNDFKIGLRKNSIWSFFDTSSVGDFILNPTAMCFDKENSNLWVSTLNGLAFYGDTLKLATKKLEKNLDFSTKVFPNPASDFFNISISTKENTNLEVSIFSIEGKYIGRIYNGNINEWSQFKFSAINLVNGIYFIQFKTNNNSEMKKIIINH
jgi:ligand-binding sensor domain-containing protein